MHEPVGGQQLDDGQHRSAVEQAPKRASEEGEEDDEPAHDWHEGVRRDQVTQDEAHQDERHQAHKKQAAHL